MTVRLNPTPIPRLDESPTWIRLSSLGPALGVLILGSVWRSQTTPLPDLAFITLMIVLSVVWFCFLVAALLLQKPKWRWFNYGPHTTLLVIGGGMIWFGFAGGGQ